MGIEQGDIADTARREVEDARVRLSEAAGRVKHEAMSAGSTISALVFDELDRRGSDLGDGLQHIAEKMRNLVETEAGESPRMVQQAVDVIDDLSHRLQHQSARELSDRVARFGRENPATFMTACLVTGVLAGRFLIAQSDDSDRAGYLQDPAGSGWRGGADKPQGREAWQSGAGNQQGDFGYRDPSDLGSAGRGDTSASVTPDEDAPSDLDLLPEAEAGMGHDQGAKPAIDTFGRPGRGTSHG